MTYIIYYIREKGYETDTEDVNIWRYRRVDRIYTYYKCNSIGDHTVETEWEG